MAATLDEVAGQIQKLSSTVIALEKKAKELGGPKDNETFRRRLKKDRDTAKNLTREIADNLKRVRYDSSDKLRFQKLSGQFKEVLAKFERVSKDSIEREKRIALKINQSLADKQYVLDEDGRGGGSQQTFADYRLTAYDASTLATEEALAKEKQNDLLELETDLEDLHSAYVEFAELVNEQQEGIDLMQKNVIVANDHMEKAVTEIKTASKYQKSSRKKMCIIIFIITFVVAAVAATIITLAILGKASIL